MFLRERGLGASAAALAAHAGASVSQQMIAAAVIGLGAVACWSWIKRRRPGAASVRSERSVNLDVGETVQVHDWLPDGTAQVKYRGAMWTVVRAQATDAQPGAYRVKELVGNRLLVEKI
jgi:membrane protein implicated in regulation of membrane protease activity